MPIILSEILDRDQHILTFLNKPDSYRPQQCPHCGKKGVWMHGVYYRNALCEKEVGCCAPIQRFFCPHCEQTCSTLPEYIPPRRWYHWAMQQRVLLLLLLSNSLTTIGNQLSTLFPERLKLPSRSTIQRWRQRFQQQYPLHHFHLCHHDPALGLCQSLSQFWLTCLEKLSLSKVMVILNQAAHPIP